MKTLDTKEWVAVVIAVFAVGFFFIFGQQLVSFFKGKTTVATPSPQVLTQDVVAGEGDTAEVGDRVVVNYVGHFVDGTVFDSSVARNEPFQFVLGSGQVIKGWDIGIVGMKVGGQRLLSVPPELAYGSADYGPIPANSTLVFEVQLLKVEKPQ